MRLPDFIIIGAMKSGTTSLFQWLGGRAEVFAPEQKEPDFFSRDERWNRGVRAYSKLFEEAGPGQITGEASPSYTDPRYARIAAPRMAGVVPDVQVIYVVRDPIERLRSHFRHQVQRGRERRALEEAIADPGNEYVERSKYFSCLEPYLQGFPRDQICVVRTEDLDPDRSVGWSRVLTHVGLSDSTPPQERYNTTRTKGQYTRAMLWMWERGLLRWASRAPRPIRRLGRRILMRDGSGFDDRLEGSQAPVPASISEAIWEDVSRLERWLGSGDLWPRATGGGPEIRADGGQQVSKGTAK